MAQGTIEHSPRLNERPDFDSNGAEAEFTSVAEIRLKTAADLEMSSWQSSVNSAIEGSPEQVQFFMDLHRSKPEACHHLAEAAAALPEVGSEMMGFRLFAELGRGAFGRVYLAQQGDLASRLVVLKVSPKIDDEARTLAQLQHTNIVPIYSVHRAGPLQAVCMPYFGATTLGSVLRILEGRKSLPASGKELVSTIVGCKTTVREAIDSRRLAANNPPSSFSCQQLEASSRAGTTESSAAAIPSVLPAGAETPSLELLQGLSYVEAVLWIGSGIAGGLAHAHERGIVHRDLKPANILLTDDGQPMLLDFNLAQDTKPGSPAAAAQAGGTLPFMAPEQIEAFRAETVLLDYRGDIYSVGVILYQLLTSRRPFPARLGPVKDVLDTMVKDRMQPPPAVCPWNEAVTPAIESIIHKCLASDPSQRYQHAGQLKEDLDRQLASLPLRHASEPSLKERAFKWKRRHPRLASTTSVAILASLLIAGLATMGVYRERRLADLDARASLSAFLDGKKNVQYLLTARTDDPTEIERGVEQGRTLLAAYQVTQDPAWREQASVRRLSAADRDQLSKNTAELLLLLARGLSLQAMNVNDSLVRHELVSEALRLNELAETCQSDEPARALWSQRAELVSLLGRDEDARTLQAKSRAIPLRNAVDYYLVATEYTSKGRYSEALPLLSEVSSRDPQDFWAWFLKGVCHDRLSQGTDALACYSTCIALMPQSPWAYLNRGLTYLRQQNYAQAAADLDRVIELRPNLVEAFKHRALARQGLKQYPEAIEDLTVALGLGAAPTQVYFLRASVREREGDNEGAKLDRIEGLRVPPTDEMGWLTRGYARMNEDPKAALEDFDQALKLNGRSLAALQNKAHILSKLGRNAEAAKVLDKAVDLYPDFIQARAGRGVLLARLGQREAAHKDAVECLARDNKPMTIYQLAGIYALTSQKNAEDRQQAFRLLSVSLQKGIGFDLIETDKDLDPIRKSPEFQKLIDAARAIRATVAAPNRKS